MSQYEKRRYCIFEEIAASLEDKEEVHHNHSLSFYELIVA